MRAEKMTVGIVVVINAVIIAVGLTIQTFVFKQETRDQISQLKADLGISQIQIKDVVEMATDTKNQSQDNHEDLIELKAILNMEQLSIYGKKRKQK